jgi:hypothetical protein
VDLKNLTQDSDNLGIVFFPEEYYDHCCLSTIQMEAAGGE